MRLLVHAPNVQQGGGKSLLLPLLQSVQKQASVTALLDGRLEISEELSGGMTIIRINPTLFGRLRGECTLHRLVRESDTVLCFGNLPPLFRIKGRTTVFLQNRTWSMDVVLRVFH